MEESPQTKTSGIKSKQNIRKDTIQTSKYKHPCYDPTAVLLKAPWLQQYPLIKTEHRPQLSYFVQQMVANDFPDFTWAVDYDPFFITELMRHGFLTMATEAGKIAVLLPKLHKERCILKFQDMIVQRGTRQKAKHFSFTINTAFDQVISGIRKQHGRECWFYPALVESFRDIYENPTKFDEEGKPKVRIHSFEIWDNEVSTEKSAAESDVASGGGGGRIVGGELGYSVGLVYTSLSGFSIKSSAGSVQMALTGMLLQSQSSPFWDLGMGLPYKMKLGALNIPRKKFIIMLNLSKLQHKDSCLSFDEFKQRHSAHDILKEFKSKSSTTPQTSIQTSTQTSKKMLKKENKKLGKKLGASTSSGAAAEVVDPNTSMTSSDELSVDFCEPSMPPPPLMEDMSDSGNMSES